MKINLDTLGSNSPKKTDLKDKEPSTGGPTTLNSSEMGLVLSTTAVRKPAASNSIAEMYHKLKRLIYLVDVSDSTNAIMAGAEAIDAYMWPTDWEATVKEKVNSAVLLVSDYEQKVADAMSDVDPDDVDEDGIPGVVVDVPPISKHVSALASLQSVEGEDLKAALVATGLAQTVVSRNYLRNQNEDHTKLGLTKTMTRKVVTERLDKYPDADVVCATFNHTVEFLPGSTKEALIANIAKITPSGGTDIMNAMQVMITFIEQAPARVKMNHIVLVTDAEDYSARNLHELLPKLVELGVVLDFIYVKQPFQNQAGEAAEAIKKVCDALGGAYKEVQSAKEFETVFLDRAQRLCLPPAPAK